MAKKPTEFVKPQTRIITGKLKGRALDLPGYTTVRPTRERVRQSLFNMLGSRMDFHGAVVFDLCCGSGAWGLEAHSRGAGRVVMVDSDVRAVERNLKSLGLGNEPWVPGPFGPGMAKDKEGAVSLVAADVAVWIPGQLADVVMLDPPYGKGLVDAVAARAAALGKPGSWWAIECGAEEDITLAGLEMVKSEVYGVSRLVIARQR